MKRISFIHAADLHLDSPMVGLKNLPQTIYRRLQESTFAAFSKIIDAAIQYHVDFIIIAGDLFDGEDRSVRAQSKLRKELERLVDHGISAFIVHGNHDHLGGNWAHLNMPSNVHIFGENVEVKTFKTKGENTVHLYGFSYPQRHVFNKKIEEYEKVSGADFHIGILHGNLQGSSDHDNYAPFQLKDLHEKQFDYWALGHIHKRAILSENPPVIYPGNIQGRNRKETGIKGCYLVELTTELAKYDLIETSQIIWEDIELNGTGLKTFNDLYQLCRTTLEEVRKEGLGILLNLTINHLSLLDKKVDEQLQLELLEALQEEEQDVKNFVWPISLKITEEIQWNKAQLESSSDFFAELFHVIEEFEAFEKSYSSLYQHSVARKFLTTLSESEKTELLYEAENLLLQQLLSEK